MSCATGRDRCLEVGIPTRTGLVATLGDEPYAVRSDGRGPYRVGTSNVLAAAAGRAAALVLTDAFVPPDERRALLVDLSYPVSGGGGSPLGVVRDDNYLSITAQLPHASADRPRSLLDLSVGDTAAAGQINVEFHLAGVPHALQSGPQPLGGCYSDGTAVHGQGTSQGRITRPDSTGGSWSCRREASPGCST